MRTRCLARAAGLLAALLTLAGGDRGPKMAEVSGTVTVDGQVPAPGSSISFIPADGNGPTAGCLIENGHYKTRVPVGTAKVQIHVPRVIAPASGVGPSGDRVTESLPPKYNSQTELTFDVKSGRNEKNWDLTTPK